MDRPQSFGSDLRLRSRRDYLELYRSSDAVIHTPFFVLYIRRNQLPMSRVGITVSRKVGTPVVRNRIKRRFREIFRTLWPDIRPSGDLVINVKRSAATADFNQLRDGFVCSIERWKNWKREPL